jgi:hypothetical protein
MAGAGYLWGEKIFNKFNLLFNKRSAKLDLAQIFSGNQFLVLL